MTVKEMRKIAKETGFKFDVCFVRWVNGERTYELTTERNLYMYITYNKLYKIFKQNLYYYSKRKVELK